MKARSNMVCLLLAFAMLFQCVATVAASWCEHSDGSRRMELPSAHSDCHDDTHEDAHDEVPESPSLKACADERVIASPAIVQPGVQFQLQPPTAIISLLAWNGLEPVTRTRLRTDAPSPPNTPLLSMGTVILLI